MRLLVGFPSLPIQGKEVPMRSRIDTTRENPLRLELAQATLRMAKRHSFQEAFIDIALDIWDASQALLDQPAAAAPLPLHHRPAV